MQHPADEELVLFFYGEAHQQEQVAEHLSQCGPCRAALDALGRTLTAVNAHEVPDPGPGYAARVWAGIEPRLDRKPAGWLSWFTPARMALAGAVALLVIAAFVAGRYTSAPGPQQLAEKVKSAPGREAAPAPVRTPPGQVRDRVLLSAVGDHLERSEMVLVELMNSAGNGPVDISGTQEWARDLVSTSRLIRQTADEAGETGLADLLVDLERLLVEIANSPSQLSNVEFERIRDGIEAQGLVFKIRVLDSQVRQRRQAPATAAATRS